MDQAPYQPPYKNEVGKVYGRLTVVERVHPKRNLLMRCRAIWRVACSCGNEMTVSGNLLRRGVFRECGTCAQVWNTARSGTTQSQA